MLNPIDDFYLKKEESVKSYLLAVRDLILKHDPAVTAEWKYGMPMFCYKGKMFCYLWTDKKTNQPYLGVVEGKRVVHPLLKSEKRSRMTTLSFDASDDIPVAIIQDILGQAIALYVNGVVKIK